MVQALLDGRKSQTRRLCAWANNPVSPYLSYIVACDEPGWFGDEEGEVQFFAGYAPGDRLWVRESYYQRGHWEPVAGARTKGGRQKWAFVPTGPISFDEPAEYRKGRHHNDPATVAWHKRLGRFMPRSLSRLTLTVTDVCVKRLQDISEADAIAEGIIEYEPTMEDPAEFSWQDGGDIWDDARSAYAALWDNINGPGAWEANPWVVAVSFKVSQGNINAGGVA